MSKRYPVSNGCPACGGSLIKINIITETDEIWRCENCPGEYQISKEPFIVSNANDRHVGRLMELSDGTKVRVLKDEFDEDFPDEASMLVKIINSSKEPFWVSFHELYTAIDNKGNAISF